jgi:hypothetical protein
VAGALDVGADLEQLRWFWLPSEVAVELERRELTAERLGGA